MLTRQQLSTRRIISMARKNGTATIVTEKKLPDYWVDTANQSKKLVKQMEGVGQGATKGKSRARAIKRDIAQGIETDLRRHNRPDHDCQMCNSIQVEAVHRHAKTIDPECILGPSKMALRNMLARSEMAYAHWENNLRDEMGPHFDEDLVL